MKPRSALQHTAKYMADKIREKRAKSQRSTADGLPGEDDRQSQSVVKKAKQDHDVILQSSMDDMLPKALSMWNDQMQVGTDRIYKSLYGVHWEAGKKYELEKLADMQARHQKEQVELEKERKQRKTSWQISKESATSM